MLGLRIGGVLLVPSDGPIMVIMMAAPPTEMLQVLNLLAKARNDLFWFLRVVCHSSTLNQTMPSFPYTIEAL